MSQPTTPKLVTRGAALAILLPYGINRTTFDKWRENQDLRPVRIPGNCREHYRTADLLRLADPPPAAAEMTKDK